MFWKQLFMLLLEGRVGEKEDTCLILESFEKTLIWFLQKSPTYIFWAVVSLRCGKCRFTCPELAHQSHLSLDGQAQCFVPLKGEYGLFVHFCPLTL